MWYLKIMGKEDLPMILAGDHYNGDLVTVFYEDFEELLTTATSLIKAGAVVIIGEAQN